MQGLSEVERSALLLKHYEGHSINEIADILEITTGACKQAIFRAVKKMRIALKPLVAT
jgi:RNA polymerase sigma-70 factor (ECF subfamily)